MQENALYIVVPCYNEESVLRGTASRLCEKMKTLEICGKISDFSKIVFVDDGSADATWSIIEEICSVDTRFSGIKLSHNQGHQYALFAGLIAVKNDADFTISIDADLQDDIDAIDDMVDAYLTGCDIVYGVRKSRSKDSFIKRISAKGYYRLLKRYGCDVVYNHADFRLMSCRAVSALSEFREQRLFLRGLVPMLGYKTAVVEYDRGVREAGVSKYTFRRMLTFALDGLFALSLRPLRIVVVLGVIMLLLAAALLIYSIVMHSVGQPASSWKLNAISIWGVGGIITLSLGVVGEYVGRTSVEVKSRPRYIIEQTIGFGGDYE